MSKKSLEICSPRFPWAVPPTQNAWNDLGCVYMCTRIPSIGKVAGEAIFAY